MRRGNKTAKFRLRLLLMDIEVMKMDVEKRLEIMGLRGKLILFQSKAKEST